MCVYDFFFHLLFYHSLPFIVHVLPVFVYVYSFYCSPFPHFIVHVFSFVDHVLHVVFFTLFYPLMPLHILAHNSFTSLFRILSSILQDCTILTLIYIYNTIQYDIYHCCICMVRTYHWIQELNDSKNDKTRPTKRSLHHVLKQWILTIMELLIKSPWKLAYFLLSERKKGYIVLMGSGVI